MSIKTSDISKCAMCTAIISICSVIQIPITSIPITLQTFGVFLTFNLLGSKLGTLSVIAYVGIGSLGFPVFSGFRGGLGVITGVTGGYIVGFILSGLFMCIAEKFFKKNKITCILLMIFGLIICYITGSLWFALLCIHKGYNYGLWKIFALCIMPFIIPDIIKIILAFMTSEYLKKRFSSKI